MFGMKIDTKTFIGQWLNTVRPGELDDLAERDTSMVDLLKPYQFAVKMAKSTNPNFYVPPDEVLTWVQANYPAHAMVLYSHKDWFYRNIEELAQYIDSL